MDVGRMRNEGSRETNYKDVVNTGNAGSNVRLKHMDGENG